MRRTMHREIGDSRCGPVDHLVSAAYLFPTILVTFQVIVMLGLIALIIEQVAHIVTNTVCDLMRYFHFC